MAKKAKGNGKAGKTAPKLSAEKRQTEIPEAKRPAIPEVDKAVAPYVNAVYQMRDLSDAIPALKATAIDALKKHKLPFYLYRDGDVKYDLEHEHVEAQDKLKIKRTVEASE